MKEIHINCDLGEGGEQDKELMKYISACNIACGGHAGTLETMQHTVDLALEHGVGIGAHPSYPDKENFGRKTLQMEPDSLKQSLVAQILSLKQIAEAEGAVLSHVKPHGALYNDAHKDPQVAGVVIDAILEFGDGLVLYAPEGSALARLAEGKLHVKHEAFLDRNYEPDGRLVSRQNPRALISGKQEVLAHLLNMVNNKKIDPLQGQEFATSATTFCIHGDNENSVEILNFLHTELPSKNIKIKRSL